MRAHAVRIVFGFLMFLLQTQKGASQFMGQRPDVQEDLPGIALQHPRTVYVEAINLPSDKPGLSRIDILYRVDLSFFIAVRKQENTLSAEFVRQGEVLIELADSTGVPVARETDKINESAREPEMKSGTSWFEEVRSFDLPPGTYAMTLTVEDLESNRLIHERVENVNAVVFPSGGISLASPFFANPMDSQSGPLIAQNFGGGVKLGARGVLILPVVNHTVSSFPEIVLSLNRSRPLPHRPEQFFADTISTATIIPSARLVPTRTISGIAYSIDTTSSGQSIAIIPFPTERIPQYGHTLALRVKFADSVHTVRKSVEGVWPDMPRSLRDFGYALQSMQNLMSPEELDSLRKGSEAEVIGRFEDFWVGKDRTPGDAYNEVMNEYYSRVDHARETFGTLKKSDGSRTDRGRIYILFGPPSRSERKLDPAGFVEIWSYESASKQFIFLDETKTGNYVLTSSRPL